MKPLCAVIVVLLSGCEQPRCLSSCATLQTLIFEDASGAPLAPLRVRDSQREVHECPPLDGGVGSDFVTCEGNRFTYDQRNLNMHVIRAEAASGEVFEGRITPVLKATAASSSSCGCEGSGLVDLTVELAKE